MRIRRKNLFGGWSKPLSLMDAVWAALNRGSGGKYQVAMLISMLHAKGVIDDNDILNIVGADQHRLMHEGEVCQ